MTIDEIKTQLGLPVLTMYRQLDQNRNETSWVYHWDNDRRIRVSMHDKVSRKIQDDKSIDILDLYSSTRVAKQSGKEYTTHEVFINKQLIKPKKRNSWDEKVIGPDHDYGSSYEKYNGYDGYSDDAIDDAFEGDPSNTWGL